MVIYAWLGGGAEPVREEVALGFSCWGLGRGFLCLVQQLRRTKECLLVLIRGMALLSSCL